MSECDPVSSPPDLMLAYCSMCPQCDLVSMGTYIAPSNYEGIGDKVYRATAVHDIAYGQHSILFLPSSPVSGEGGVL